MAEQLINGLALTFALLFSTDGGRTYAQVVDELSWRNVSEQRRSVVRDNPGARTVAGGGMVTVSSQDGSTVWVWRRSDAVWQPTTQPPPRA